MRKSKSEIIDLILVTLVLGFCFSFKDWGMGAFDVTFGLRNFFIVLINHGNNVNIIICRRAGRLRSKREPGRETRVRP